MFNDEELKFIFEVLKEGHIEKSRALQLGVIQQKIMNYFNKPREVKDENEEPTKVASKRKEG